MTSTSRTRLGLAALALLVGSVTSCEQLTGSPLG